MRETISVTQADIDAAHEFGAYHVAWWSPSGEVCGRCQKAIQHLIQGGARCAACYSIELAEVKAEERKR